MSTTPSVQGTSLQSGPPRSTSPFNQTSSSPSMQGASFISKRRSGNFPELGEIYNLQKQNITQSVNTVQAKSRIPL